MVLSTTVQRKIIHLDMDCFFAAIEIRNNPYLKGKPVAVGGSPTSRGVLSTCNYIARKFGLHSAMPTTRALKLCPDLILLPVRMEKYRAASKVIYRIFKQYTSQVERLSLDEAFLDVTRCTYCHGSATLIAETIRRRIYKELKLTASAGVAPNKFLAKIASDWKKPNGLFVIHPNDIQSFMLTLPVGKIMGVGPVMEKKLSALNIYNCGDLQQVSRIDLIRHLGQWGVSLYDLCRGIDNRAVQTHRTRKSISTELTFPYDLSSLDECLKQLPLLEKSLQKRLNAIATQPIASQFLKIKCCDFSQTTIERKVHQVSMKLFKILLQQGFQRYNKPVRLLGLGIKFQLKSKAHTQLILC